MRVRVGCRFDFDTGAPVPAILQIRPRLDGPHVMVSCAWAAPEAGPSRSYLDGFGNVCDRLVLGAGCQTVDYQAFVEVPAACDDVDKAAAAAPVDELPDEALVYLLSSRFCHPDVVVDEAWSLFGATTPGWERVQAVCDWVHTNIRYTVGASTAVTTAVDVLGSRTGVCRDYTHVGMTFCRALNIPARYVAGYLPDIGVEPPDLPMDFCSWFEAYLDGRWWTFDPRNNEPRIGRVVIARGRDAVDAAMVTTYGPASLVSMTVWADEAGT